LKQPILGFFGGNFENVVDGDDDTNGNIGLMRLWANNEGKKTPKSTRNLRKSTSFIPKSTKSEQELILFEHFLYHTVKVGDSV
jgi:hypothetical protein